MAVTFRERAATAAMVIARVALAEMQAMLETGAQAAQVKGPVQTAPQAIQPHHLEQTERLLLQRALWKPVAMAYQVYLLARLVYQEVLEPVEILA
jgi:hypothetical protein